MHAQFGRDREQLDSPDLESFDELLCIYNQSNDVDTDPVVLHRLCAKVKLMGAEALEKESLALHKMVVASGGNHGENTGKVSILLEKVKDFLLAKNGNSSISATLTCAPSACDGQAYTEHRSYQMISVVQYHWR